MNCALSANTEHKHAPWQALLRTPKASQNEGPIQSPQEPSLDRGVCVFLVALLSSQCAKDTAARRTHDLDNNNVLSELGGWLPSREYSTPQEVFSNTPHLMGKLLSSTGKGWRKPSTKALSFESWRDTTGHEKAKAVKLALERQLGDHQDQWQP